MIWVVPGVLAVTESDALVRPAGTVTWLGTWATSDALLVTVMIVSVGWTALMATVKELVPPWVIVRAGGVRLLIVGDWAQETCEGPRVARSTMRPMAGVGREPRIGMVRRASGASINNQRSPIMQ